MRFIELFGGIGGFSLGIKKATEGKWRRIWYNDSDKYAVRTFNKNFRTKYKAKDIRKVSEQKVPEHDLLCAGFPCQSFSIAGKRRGFEDTRGTLFFEILRIAKHHRTPFLLLENVKGLLSHDEGQTMARILKNLSELGYNLQWQVLNSKHFGVPQNRERVFIIGNLRKFPRPKIFPITKTKAVKEEDKMKENIIPRFDGREGRSCLRAGRVPEISQALQTDGMLRQGCSFGTNNPQSSRNIRRLTPIECERLQGFPDGWTEGISDTQRYKQLGNAVTVNVIESIVRRWINGTCRTDNDKL